MPLVVHSALGADAKDKPRHTIIDMTAVKAGKDVYSEKPLALVNGEGKRLVKEHKGVQRIGSQQRSDKLFREAWVLVRAGRLGKLAAVTSVLPAGLRGGSKAAKAPEGWTGAGGRPAEGDGQSS